MNIESLLRTMVRSVLNSPPVFTLRERRYRKYFFDCRDRQILQYGLFSSYSDAEAYLTGKCRAGYVIDPDWYLNHSSALETYDYPVILWLKGLVDSGASVFDFGGNVGVSYYNYARYINYPDTMQWVVCEQDDEVAYGKSLQTERGAKNLSFVTDIGEASGRAVFFSSGCLQYVPTPLSQLLRELPQPPPHLILNKLPLYDNETRATLQNTGQSITPYWLFNRTQFIADLEELGYRLIDSWACPWRAVHIPFNQSHNVPFMSGLYLCKEESQK